MSETTATKCQSNEAETLAAVSLSSVSERLRIRSQVVQGATTHPVPFIVLNDGERVEYVSRIFQYPERANGTVQLLDDASFIEHFNRYKQPASLIYAIPDPLTFVAVYDENETDESTRQVSGKFRDHRAILRVSNSAEWRAWNNISGHKFEGNVQFAAFLEDNLPDIVSPSPAVFMKIALNMSRSEQVAFGSAIRLSDGNTKFAYSSEISGNAVVDGQTVTIPESFRISIPVWQGLKQPCYEIDVRLKHRGSSSGRMSIWMELVRPSKVLERAFADAWEKIANETSSKILYGTPE
jgi:uncharacterized protein YfdQ (DUF2303 family)